MSADTGTHDRGPAAVTAGEALVQVDALRIEAPDGRELVSGVSFELARGGSLGIVGESGSGKTLTTRSLLGLLPHGISVTGGSVVFDGMDLRALRRTQWEQVRGSRIGAVFQDPASYLNPSIAVGKQLTEVLRVRGGLSRSAARERAAELLGSLGLHQVDLVLTQYPHELSGGMLQRVLLAIAICLGPELLIADEATTALDVTVQADVLDLFETVRVREGLALVLVSHDLAVVSRSTENLLVMRDGVVVEAGPTAQVLADPRHPYTRLLVEHHDAYSLAGYLEKETADV
ncbi:ABC transporter ATP-binding protein [Occultella glacieicola]|uniref:ABC transporter ATP-binding protein n=1 Tax=Occultella glacieicola TaxID=2518684 RepID=A0ABY2E6V6_9MICO|nr:ABC transporter ATP-binding protein [Occultella glacieicola]TDE97282.1 ABC transporter ATP-binding protein [Occultella glacieicola]